MRRNLATAPAVPCLGSGGAPGARPSSLSMCAYIGGTSPGAGASIGGNAPECRRINRSSGPANQCGVALPCAPAVESAGFKHQMTLTKGLCYKAFHDGRWGGRRTRSEKCRFCHFRALTVRNTAHITRPPLRRSRCEATTNRRKPLKEQRNLVFRVFSKKPPNGAQKVENRVLTDGNVSNRTRLADDVERHTLPLFSDH